MRPAEPFRSMALARGKFAVVRRSRYLAVPSRLLQKDGLVVPSEKIRGGPFPIRRGYANSRAAKRVIASAILIVVSQSIANFQRVVRRHGEIALFEQAMKICS